MDIWDEMASNWPSKIISRDKIGSFTGGMIAPRTMANLDALGKGVPPAGRVRVGRKVGYHITYLTAFLRKRSSEK